MHTLCLESVRISEGTMIQQVAVNDNQVATSACNFNLRMQKKGSWTFLNTSTCKLIIMHILIPGRSTLWVELPLDCTGQLCGCT